MKDQINEFAKVLRRHDGSDYCNAKVIAQAGGYDSSRSGYNLLTEGLSFYPWFKSFMRKLQRAGAGAVVLDLFKDMAEELPITVSPTEGTEDRPPFEQCAVVMQVWANVTRTVVCALRDNRISDGEEAVLMPLLNEAEREIAALRRKLGERRSVRLAK